MKKLIVIIALLLCAALPSIAQKNKGLLFEISGKGLAKASYIFGTFHIVCREDMLPLDKLTALVNSSEQTIMEIDMDDPAELQAMVAGSRSSNGKPLSELLSPEKYKKVDDTVREYLGVPVDTMKTMKPSLIGIRILTSPKALGCEDPSGYDLSILRSSIIARKPVIGLETVAFQSKVLEEKPIDKQ
ncbi:MAG: TraB/GumN family protein, partial [Acidobacteria bacterium]|nr:TraB/GumN family protein [Acidobacteriota bacterium]